MLPQGGHRALLRIPGFRGFRNATVCKVTAAWRACFHPAADWVAQSKCKVGAETEIAQGQPVEGNQCRSRIYRASPTIGLHVEPGGGVFTLLGGIGGGSSGDWERGTWKGGEGGGGDTGSAGGALLGFGYETRELMRSEASKMCAPVVARLFNSAQSGGW
ncbi:hypothetical protein AAMO2058_000162400 [Amorphochlora amoebiformis]